ncbi:hypothetical protein AK830_g12292 [Neonectria ditissima]|uniref:PD-(D/E)XK nuclease-like domain-containing protein n=1 Tax=Neonectria ditissima TaxID=78410 RepID=A0A0P7B3M8_9HYPO|nr:hypothetical protein AK830_g12292 [Neonectria ditissima]
MTDEHPEHPFHRHHTAIEPDSINQRPNASINEMNPTRSDSQGSDDHEEDFIGHLRNLSIETFSPMSTSTSASSLEPLGDGECSEPDDEMLNSHNLQDAGLVIWIFLSVMHQVSLGNSIVPLHMEAELYELEQSFPHFGAPDKVECFFEQPTHQLGDTPAVEKVLDIVEEAWECQRNTHAKENWDMTVQNLLRLAFRRPNQGCFSHLCNFMPCASAPVGDDYLAADPSPHRVDFCIYLDPIASQPSPGPGSSPASGSLSDMGKVISEARRLLPNRSVNHMTYHALRERPVAFGIKTMKAGEDWGDASLQLGLWQIAQWNFMRRLVVQGSYLDQNRAVGDEAPRERVLPHFVPGIIIEGHLWHLFISTQAGDEIVVGNRITMGSTETVQGVYQIVMGLQTLRDWAEFLYWPVLAKLIREAY